MTDAHFHRGAYDTFLAFSGGERRFFGTHPWQVDETPPDVVALRAALVADPSAGVGEIGLDRLRSRVVSTAQREAFAAQLELAAELRRPVVLHGAKCWGEVVKECRRFAGRIPAFLFHGFSRSEGLLPEMFAMNGFVSIGPAILNDHAVNYRRMAAALPEERILAETDAAWDDAAAHETQIAAIVARLAELRGTPPASLAETIEISTCKFLQYMA